MKVKQINLRKSFAATHLFASQLESSTIGLLTEPYHYKNKIPKLGSLFELFPDTTLSSPPRAAILVPRSLQATYLPHLSGPDVTVLFFRRHKLLVVSGYCDKNLEMIQPWMTDIMDYADNKNCKIVLGLDSNAHSELYGQETDGRGEILEEFILNHGLEVNNRGTTPTFCTLRGTTLATSFIDITLSRDLTIVDWLVDETFNNSDHNTLSYELLLSPEQPRLIRPWKKANWKRFSRILQKTQFFEPTKMSIKKLDKLVQSLYKILLSALDKSCPLRPAHSDDCNLKWWNASLTKESRKLNKQFKIAKRCKSLTETVKLKLMKQKFKRLCKKGKRNSWRKFTFNLNETDRLASLARTLQNKERNKLYTLKRPNGTMTDPGSETLDLLFQTHFPASTPLHKVDYQQHTLHPPNSDSEFIKQRFNHWLNLELLNKAFKKFNKKKSPGPDGIKPVVFDHLPDNFKRHLLFLYKCCIHFHYTPVLWKDTKVIFIPKPGKDDYTLPKSFRPISLSNYFLKALERLVCWNMDLSLRVYPIHERQHGFMAGRSTESAISMTTNYIEKYLAHKEHCLGVFLDISAAFDSINIDHVRRALLKHGGEPNMVGWYHNYLSHRNLFSELHHEHASCSTGVGFPQGGVCSARFWLIAFNQAIKIINSTFVEGIGYADDCCILMGGTDQSHMVAQVQRVINKLITWGNTCGLRFNHSKTVVVLFTPNSKKFRKHIKIDGNPIPYSKKVKYLGLTLDSKLNWSIHVKEKAIACKRFLFMVARITRDSFGPAPKMMRWAYHSIVRPMLTYGALCWAHKIDANHFDNILRNLNRAGMNTFSNFPRSTPTCTVEIITNTTPLSLHAIKTGLSSRIRLRDIVKLDWTNPFDSEGTSFSHIKFWDQLIYDCNLEFCLEDDDFVTLAMPLIRYTVDTDSFSGDSKYLSPSQYNVFTDGSKLNSKVGAGVFITTDNQPLYSHSFRLPDKSTVFQAEIFAINRAAIFLRSIPHPRYIKFFVDSQAALLALNNTTVTSRLVGDTIHNLNLLPGKIRLVWIKAHVGHTGNECADELAKNGTLLPAADIFPVPLPKQVTKSAIKFAIDEIWNLQWVRYPDGRQSKQFFPLPNRQKAKFCYNLSRQELGRLIRIVTGHNNLFYHRSNVDKSLSTSPLCRFCGEERETFHHFATNCPCFRLSRLHYFQSDTCFRDGSWSVRQLLDFSNIPSIAAALGGNFDPALHLEVQRDMEDLIESEQVNADLQPGRRHSPSHPVHVLSDSDMSDSSNLETQEHNRRQLILSAHRIHPLSSSSDDSGENQQTILEVRRPLGPEAASEVVDSLPSSFSGHSSSSFHRIKINYTTFDITDDEYLHNSTFDEEDEEFQDL